MQRPHTIQIFHPDDSPRSIKIAEITNRAFKAILIPRNQLENAAKRKEVSNIGLYFLFGETDEAAKPLIYISEAENMKPCFPISIDYSISNNNQILVKWFQYFF